MRSSGVCYITRRCTAVGNVPHLAVQGVSTVFVLIARFGHTDGDSLLYIEIVIFNQNKLLTPFFQFLFFNENVLLTHTLHSKVRYISFRCERLPMFGESLIFVA